MDTESSPQPVITKSEGSTPTEKHLEALGRKSFLSLWSYANVFRNPKAHGKGDGKELCDLLVVFGDDVLIFSDKSCEFPNTGQIELDWSRWFKKAIWKSAEQCWGAERWLRSFPNQIFLDKPCTQPFPLELPSPEKMRVHHIVLAHNVAARCAAYFGGGSSPTLMFESDIVGGDHYQDTQNCRPFRVGWLDPSKTFVHVFDDKSLEILMGELDTTTDFVDYLRAREELLQSFRRRSVRFLCVGEEDLLANYLTTMTADRHGFHFPDGYNSIALAEGDWVDFLASPQRAAKRQADQVSYAWDDLIEIFNKHILNGTSYFVTSPIVADREKLIRFLAREPRVRRRLLAKSVHDLIGKTLPNMRSTRIECPSNPGDPYYCFLLLPRSPSQQEDEYRAARRECLSLLCHITKVVFPGAQDIVGLATEPGVARKPRSEDALHLDARQWTEEMEVWARSAQRQTGFLTKLSRNEGTVREYPNPASDLRLNIDPGHNPRNKQCPCGSGLKFKRCHGR